MNRVAGFGVGSRRRWALLFSTLLIFAAAQLVVASHLDAPLHALAGHSGTDCVACHAGGAAPDPAQRVADGGRPALTLEPAVTPAAPDRPPVALAASSAHPRAPPVS